MEEEGTGGMGAIYRVAIQLVANLPLTSKQKFHFGLARPGRPGQNGTYVLKSTGGTPQGI